MPFPVSFYYHNPIMLASSSIPQKRNRNRPRGIWKARVTAPRFSARNIHQRHSPHDSISEPDSDIIEDCSSPTSDNDDDSSDEDEKIYYWDYSTRCSPYPDRVSGWATRTRIMDTSSTATGGSPDRDTCDWEDWEDLKELFAKAAEQYESDESPEALPILRGVIHECHRFLLYYQDPSILFTSPTPATTTPSSTATTTAAESPPPPSSESTQDWSSDRRCGPIPSSSSIATSSRPRRKERKCKCIELPTAFHAILGTALFLFGNLIAQDTSLALKGEPDSPVPYWLAALDVFETGENLPTRTNGLGCEPPEDWRMAIVWGRTLVCLADETVTRALKAKESGTMADFLSPTAQFSAEEPDWPPESPFSAIAARRPPVTRRMSLFGASAHDLMVLAMDQFSRGIFHMPHPQHMQIYQNAPPNSQPAQESFSRAKELFTIASEVLLLAEKLDVPSERQYWASWADSVFNQMKMEADMDAWRGPITRARGRCWLIVGSARVEDLEAALERGEMDILQSEDAQEAREGLSTAISFFERAKGSATVSALSDPESQELQTLLAEALLTLANLTPDVQRREELYARAQLEGGQDYGLEDEDEDEDEDMDES